ncbi:MAG: glutamate-5-semialdehyde dehydrogenase [Gammaproteobacteria bacterium]|nr:glutamate-5-semialdehyde dehydrogenase [Gammaproteobacteria bacterium]MDE0302599.1 glutamate-5-semialdehyde dehydrogenase [Gammaproteobacteria bacterium]
MPDENLDARIAELGQAARAAGRVIAASSAEARNQAVRTTASLIRERTGAIVEANMEDVEAARAHRDDAFIDRLALDESRIEGLAVELEHIAELPDLLGRISDVQDRSNGLKIGRMRVPIGVIGMIYEARPGVTVEAGGLCIKSGNAVILRGGSESYRSNQALADCLQEGLRQASLPPEGAQLLPTTDRAAIDALLKMDQWVDLIIPRGGTELIERVRSQTHIPMLKHLHGVCHVYIDDTADRDQAIRIAVNSKTQRYGVCNAMETLLVAKSRAEELLPILGDAYAEHGVEIRGCPRTCELLKQAVPAAEEDWTEEYLSPVLSVRVVADLDEAMDHIAKYGSQHTDAIVTADDERAKRFMREVDSSSVMVNTSTRFADGFEYGLGAEIGISTDKLHARGPVGLEGLTSQKFVVYGDGQIRV